MTKKILIIGIVIILIVGGLVSYKLLFHKNYFLEIEYTKLKEKINNKEDFILVITQTTCSHCMSYKPKVRDIANEYKIETYYIEADLLSDDELKEFKNTFYFTGTPTTIFIKDGKELSSISRINGDLSNEKIIKKYKKNGFI